MASLPEGDSQGGGGGSVQLCAKYHQRSATLSSYFLVEDEEAASLKEDNPLYSCLLILPICLLEVFLILAFIAERLSARLLIVQCSQLAFVCMYVYIYIRHTLIAWARFLWSRPQTTY